MVCVPILKQHVRFKLCALSDKILCIVSLALRLGWPGFNIRHQTVFKLQRLGNISLGSLILMNIMTLWYQWSVSKLGQLPKLVGQLTASILHRPQQRWSGFITLVSHEHALTPPSKAQLILIAWKIIICAGNKQGSKFVLIYSVLALWWLCPRHKVPG